MEDMFVKPESLFVKNVQLQEFASILKKMG
jgi:hypothetical protein